MTKNLKSFSPEDQYEDVQNQLAKVHTRCLQWQDGLLRKSNLELYGILSECFDIYCKIVPSSKSKKHLNQILTSRNVKYTSGTSLHVKVVRYVFGECNEEFTYARALRVGYSEKPTSTPFAEWLTSSGGPAGIKQKPDHLRTQALAKLADACKIHYQKSAVLASFKAIGELTAHSDADHNYAVALVRPSTENPENLEVIFGSNNRALVEKVLVAAGKAIPEAEMANLVKQSADTVPAELDNLISLPDHVGQSGAPN